VAKPLDRYKIGPGQYFIPVSHRAYWLTADQRQRLGPWLDALDQFDRRRNIEPLKALLRSSPVPDEIGPYLADLLDRHKLLRRAHRPRTPAYDLSKAESKKRLAKEFFDTLRKSGKSFDESVALAAESYSLKKNAFANYCGGKSGGSRRMKKRRTIRP
jgi:hypothetical protein